MKRFFAFLISAVLVITVCGCGNRGYGIDGTYRTKTAYGMEDFYSTIEIEGNRMELEVEHFDETVEEYEGIFKIEKNIIILNENGPNRKEFIYDSLNKTIQSDEMETIWSLSSTFEEIID